MKQPFIRIFLAVAILVVSSPVLAKENKDTLELLELFGDVFQKVREEYVEEPSDEELIEAAINGMLTDLDPHSSYLNKKDFQEMQVQTKGEFGGLGIEVTMDKGSVHATNLPLSQADSLFREAEYRLLFRPLFYRCSQAYR
jgi:carboxyl-terminal processing protease